MTDDNTIIDNCIFAFNLQGAAIQCAMATAVAVNCSDLFSNSGGDWVGCVAEQSSINGNFSIDPFFCDTASYDFRLHHLSPCIPANNSCLALIGALGICCSDSTDIDNDGLIPCNDNCPSVFNPGQEDFDMDDIGDLCDSCFDSDHDGFGNPGFPQNSCLTDNCPSVFNTSQQDSDMDGYGDDCDNCPIHFNPSQIDGDNDGIGDECDACPSDATNDVDNDGYCGNSDNCPTVNNPNQADSDLDGRGNVCDNCINTPNPLQEDTDLDAVGDSCDNCISDSLNDFDADNVCGDIDNCPIVENSNQNDTDSDGVGDACCCIGNRGDANHDGNDANTLDLNFLVNRIFRSGSIPRCPKEADCNSDGTSGNIVDLNFLVNRIFRGGPVPGACS